MKMDIIGCIKEYTQQSSSKSKWANERIALHLTGCKEIKPRSLNAVPIPIKFQLIHSESRRLNVRKLPHSSASRRERAHEDESARRQQEDERKSLLIIIGMFHVLIWAREEDEYRRTYNLWAQQQDFNSHSFSCVGAKMELRVRAHVKWLSTSIFVS